MKKILIIEDDPQFQSIYAERFKTEGYEITVASTAKEGLDFLTTTKPDLILLDVMLPGGMNGFDVLEHLKKTPDLSSIPVIMLTNLDTEEKVAREIGVVDYIVKANLSLQEVVDKVKKYIG